MSASISRPVHQIERLLDRLRLAVLDGRVPSASATRRSAKEAATASWVTITTVWPKSSTAWRSSSSTSSDALESRLPVGSSANRTAGRMTVLARSRRAAAVRPTARRDGGRVGRRSRSLSELVEPLAVDITPGDRQRQQDVLFGAQHRQQVERLEDETDPIAPQLGQVVVIERSTARRRRVGPFPRSVGPGRRACA